MSNSTSNNKRIAKNAIFLYARTIVTTIVGIFTSRILLQTLGVEDYGVYSVAGGVVGMLAFINGSMYGATTRYITYELGRGDKCRLHDTFCSTLIIHSIIAIIVIVVAESIGLWFLNNKLVFPEGRLWAAQWVYHLSILATVIDITQTPYTACMTAHERFDIIAYVNMFSTFAKLGILYLLVCFPYDYLVTYAVLIFLISLSTLVFVRIFCMRHYEESRFELRYKKELMEPMFKFFGWEVIGGIGRVTRLSGVNMVINIFCGVAVNAAVGIGNTVSGAVNGLSYNIVSAFQPSITKCFAQGNLNAFEQAVIKASSISFMLFSLFAVPLIAQCRYILDLWLVEVPQYATEICTIHLFFNCFVMIDAVVSHALKAMNKNMGQNVVVSIMGFITIILVYACFTWNLGILSAIVAFDSVICVTMGCNIYQYYKNSGPGVGKRFILQSLLRVTILFVAALCITYYLSSFLPSTFLSLIITIIVSTIIIVCEIIFVVMNQTERHKLYELVARRIKFSH